MDDNEELYTASPQDISNVFAASDLSSCSSSDSAKYKRAWIKAKLIRFYILFTGEHPCACSRVLSIALNNKQIAPIMAVNGAIYPQKYANEIT